MVGVRHSTRKALFPTGFAPGVLTASEGNRGSSTRKLKRSEDDLDYHLVLRSGSRTMIAETPSPLCTQARPCTGASRCRGAQGGTGLHEGSCRRSRLLRLQPRPDRRRPERDRACTPSLALPAFRRSAHPSLLRLPRAPRRKCAASYPDECIAPPPPDLDCANIAYRAISESCERARPRSASLRREQGRDGVRELVEEVEPSRIAGGRAASRTPRTLPRDQCAV